MTGKDPIEIPLSGGTFRAFIFSSGVEALDIEAFRDDRKQHFQTFYEFINFDELVRKPKFGNICHSGERRNPVISECSGPRRPPG